MVNSKTAPKSLLLSGLGNCAPREICQPFFSENVHWAPMTATLALLDPEMKSATKLKSSRQSGYSNNYSGQPSVYYTPSYSSGYVAPQYVAPYVVSRPSVNVQQSNPNVYNGPMSADGQPTGDLRPGMVLPDGSVVVSVGSSSK